jgi:translation initiation factor 2B subunit (eIF-2B alpha/beta/delta family)
VASSSGTGHDAADECEMRESALVDVEELEVLLDIAAEYGKVVVHDGRPRLRQRKLVKRLEAARAR